jgi:hypothetical protein
MLSLQLGDQETETPSPEPSTSRPAASAAPDTPAVEQPSSSTSSLPQDFELTSTTYVAAPFETVTIVGNYLGAERPTTLRVQRFESGSWVNFPLPSVTDTRGDFSAYVELGSPGSYRLRIADLEADVVSDVIRLEIG